MYDHTCDTLEKGKFIESWFCEKLVNAHNMEIWNNKNHKKINISILVNRFR